MMCGNYSIETQWFPPSSRPMESITRSRARRFALAGGALLAALALATPAQADLTASPDRTIIPHYPDFVQDVNGQQAALCVTDIVGSSACAPSASIADMTDPGPGGDAEAFYWQGAA